jgi:hypothetical protein
MRRHPIGILSALFCAFLIAACSASGNDPTVAGSGTGPTDSGAAADASYNYGDSGSNLPGDSGTVSPPKDSGSTTVPFDAGPDPTSNDCDLSGSGAIGYLTALESGGGDGACNATDDSCSSASDCCVNIAALLSGGGSLPTGFGAIFGSGTAATCVPK